MGIYEDIQNGQDKVNDAFKKALPPTLNEMVEDIKKAKAAQIGEIRTWSGVKMRKEANGWVPVKEGSGGKGKEEEGKIKEAGPEDLLEHARNASETALMNATKVSGDPAVREAAHKELMRRKSEEAQETFKVPGDGIVRKTGKGGGDPGREKDGNEYDEEGKTTGGKAASDVGKEALKTGSSEGAKKVLDKDADEWAKKKNEELKNKETKKEEPKKEEKKESVKLHAAADKIKAKADKAEKDFENGKIDKKEYLDIQGEYSEARSKAYEAEESEDGDKEKEGELPFEKKMKEFRKEMADLGEKITNYKTEKEFDDYMLQIKAVTAEMKAFVTKEMKAQGDKLVKDQQGKKVSNNYKIKPDDVKAWIGEDYSDEQINGVMDTLYEEGSIEKKDLEVKGAKNPEQHGDMVQEKIDDLYGEVREGLWPADLKGEQIKEILWGVIMSS